MSERALALVDHLSAIGAEISAATPSAVAAGRLLSVVVPSLEGVGFVAKVGHGDRAVRLLAAEGLDPAARDVWDGLALDAPVPMSEAIRTGAAVFTTGPLRRWAGQLPRLAGLPAADLDRIWAFVPIRWRGRVEAVLALAGPTHQPFTNQERHIATVCATLASQVLERCAGVPGIAHWEWHPASNRTLWSDEMHRLLGLAVGDVEPSLPARLELIPPEVRHAVLTAVKAARDGLAPFDIEMRTVRADGALRWFRCRADVIRGVDGIERWFGTDIDVTDEHETEDRLRQGEEQFRLLAASSPLGVFLCDGEGTLLYANPRLGEILGHPVPALEGTHFPPPDVAAGDESPASAWEAARQAGREHVGEMRIARADGTGRVVRARLAPAVRSGGSIRRFVGTVEDITSLVEEGHRRRETDRQLQEAERLESLGVLAGGIAHDYNNLLVGILGNASYVRDELPPDSPLVEALRDIEQAAQRAAELTRQLLAYSGKGRFIVAPLDIAALVREQQGTLAALAGPRTRLQVVLPAAPCVVEGDDAQLRQLLNHLVANAVEALPDTGGTVTVRVRSEALGAAELRAAAGGDVAPPGDYCVIEVADTGAGMDADTVARMFDPFFTTKRMGRGLGAAATLGIARGHRGVVHVDSAPGLGTTLRVAIPRAAAGALATDDAPPARHRSRILVVDDEATVRRVALRVLERAGFDVVEAVHGAEAIERFDALGGAVDLVLLDLSMPVMDGTAALRELRRRKPTLPVLMTSGYAEKDLSPAQLDGQQVSFVQKPFASATLLTAVKRVLEPA